MEKTPFGFLFPLFMLIVVPLSLEGQITITSSDIQKPVGYEFSVENSNLGSFPIDLGSTGGPQTWDFTSYSTPNMSSQQVVNPGNTPFASDFPTANQCFLMTEEGLSEDAYQYNRVESSTWIFQGIGFDSPDTSFSQVWDPMGQIPLPITMESSWVWEMGWQFEFLGVITILEQREHATVDAYGTMVIPSGSYEVLRIMSYDTTITTTDFGPIQFADTTATIDYSWFGRDPIFVASASSMEGETNPDFTTAAYISRAGSRTAIGDGGGEVKIPLAIRLEQNAPNPFNPRTDITFTVSEELQESVELAVFTVRGQRVRTLVSGHKEPGTYTVSWDGRNEEGEALPSGLYLYRLTTGGKSETRKMIMAK